MNGLITVIFLKKPDSKLFLKANIILNLGYSALWLLAESHFAVHTFPEERKSYIELSSCVEDKFYKFIDMVKNEQYQITII